MSTTEEKTSNKLNFLYNAINDTQEVIRFSDTKSGVVFVLGTGLLAASVTLADKYLILIDKLKPYSKVILLSGSAITLAFLIIALILSLRSINPANNPNNHVDIGDWTGMPKVSYYLSGLLPPMRGRTTSGN